MNAYIGVDKSRVTLPLALHPPDQEIEIEHDHILSLGEGLLLLVAW